MTKQKIIQIFERLKAQNPEPRSELKYRSRFELLIAVMLSAQATDVGVNKATRVLFKHANTAKKMSALSLEQIERLHQDDRVVQHQSEQYIKNL